MLPTRETYSIEIAGIQRELPLFEVKPGLRIALLNILGDTELVQACATALAARIQDIEYDLLVTAEAKSIPLVHALAVVERLPMLSCVRFINLIWEKLYPQKRIPSQRRGSKAIPGRKGPPVNIREESHHPGRRCQHRLNVEWDAQTDGIGRGKCGGRCSSPYRR
jgi:hypothetical protein